MTFTIPVRFSRFAGQAIPTIDVGVRLLREDAMAWESALIDTGSSLTLFPRRLLRRRGFPIENARRPSRSVRGVGGSVVTRFLADAIFTVVDSEGALHPFNQPRLFMVDGAFPPILGRGFLRQMNARLTLDFVDEAGHLEIG